MKNKYQRILKKGLAMMIALLMALSVLPAAMAASEDWDQLLVSVSWTDENGETQTAYAYPLYPGCRCRQAPAWII